MVATVSADMQDTVCLLHPQVEKQTSTGQMFTVFSVGKLCFFAKLRLVNKLEKRGHRYRINMSLS